MKNQLAARVREELEEMKKTHKLTKKEVRLSQRSPTDWAANQKAGSMI